MYNSNNDPENCYAYIEKKLISINNLTGNKILFYLNQACRDTGAGRDDGLETAVVHHEVTHYTKKLFFLKRCKQNKLYFREN